MELIADAKQAILMIKFISNHEEDFIKVFPPLFIGLMQLTTNLAAEVVNIIMLMTRHDLEHVLAHFVALEMLTNIDNIYYNALPALPLM